jgi:putative transcriptional regulator
MANPELLQNVVDSLHESDFEVYYNEGLRRYFDIIAVKDYKVFIKALMNIDNLGAVEGNELHRFSEAFDSQSIVVGMRAGMEPLKDDVIYQRHGNPSVNPATFRKILKGESVSAFTKRGQFLVSIDGDALRELREKKGMSQDDLARILECTGQTVYRMEKQNRIQQEQFDKLLDYFGRDIDIGSVQLNEPSGRIEMPLSDPLKKEIVREYLRLKLDSMTSRTPMDFVLEEKPILTPVSRTEGELRSKQRIAKGLEDILECKTVHITKEKKARRLPYLTFEELHYITSKDEILEKE